MKPVLKYLEVSNLGRGFSALFQWAEANQMVLAWLFSLSLVLFIGSLAAIPLVIARMRRDYFVAPNPDEHSWLGRHPAARLTARIIKNVVGAALLVAGLAMMVLPGQGIITVLVALSLLEFPGKRALELRLIRQQSIGRAVNWIRKKSGREPLMIPED